MAEEAAAVSFRHRCPTNLLLWLLRERGDRRVRRNLRQKNSDHFGYRATSWRYPALSGRANCALVAHRTQIYGELTRILHRAVLLKPELGLKAAQEAIRTAAGIGS